jgi:predicted DsbA family dithiol-disulfide isomerase
MTTQLKVDFVSDVSCPWCAIGLASLEAALAKLDSGIEVQLHFQPFELNPQMGRDGVDAVEHLVDKLRVPREQIEHNQEAIRARGAELGFVFDMQKRKRIYNTFDAHRLLFWADNEGKQRPLKRALLAAYFTEGRDVGDHAVLADIAANVGLDEKRAQQILESSEFANEVREREHFYTSHGIHGVPAIIINDKHLIEGGQPPEVFEQVLRQVVAQGG